MAIQKKKLNDVLTSSLITQKVPNMLTRKSLPIASGKYVNVVQLPYNSRIDVILSLFTYANQPPFLVLLSAQNATARVVRMQKIGEMGNTQFGVKLFYNIEDDKSMNIYVRSSSGEIKVPTASVIVLHSSAANLINTLVDVLPENVIELS